MIWQTLPITTSKFDVEGKYNKNKGGKYELYIINVITISRGLA